MSLVPEEKLKPSLSINLTPMIDFLFLMLAFFATLAVTRAALFDTRLDLVKLQKEKSAKMISSKEDIAQINISIAEDGNLFWITDIQDFPMEDIKAIQNEIFHHYNIGLLPKDKKNTEILLHIDKNAKWDSVAKLIFAIRQTGFNAFPVYKSIEN